MNKNLHEQYTEQEQERKIARRDINEIIYTPGAKALLLHITEQIRLLSNGYDGVKDLQTLGEIQGGVKFGKNIIAYINTIKEEFANESE